MNYLFITPKDVVVRDLPTGFNLEWEKDLSSVEKLFTINCFVEVPEENGFVRRRMSTTRIYRTDVDNKAREIEIGVKWLNRKLAKHLEDSQIEVGNDKEIFKLRSDATIMDFKILREEDVPNNPIP